MKDQSSLTHWTERTDMAAAFRWTARLNMHEEVANHFSLAVNDDGSRFLIDPAGRHFARITASSLIEIDAHDPATMDRPDAPDPTAWGLHGSLHRACPQARCAMHVHSSHATVLTSLEDSRLPAIDQNTAKFHNRVVVDDHYGGIAFADEAARCVQLLADPKITTLMMGNHGVLVIGRTVAETFNRLFYFERAAETYVRALQTGRPLRHLPEDIAEENRARMGGLSRFRRGSPPRDQGAAGCRQPGLRHLNWGRTMSKTQDTEGRLTSLRQGATDTGAVKSYPTYPREKAELGPRKPAFL